MALVLQFASAAVIFVSAYAQKLSPGCYYNEVGCDESSFTISTEWQLLYYAALFAQSMLHGLIFARFMLKLPDHQFVPKSKQTRAFFVRSAF